MLCSIVCPRCRVPCPSLPSAKLLPPPLALPLSALPRTARAVEVGGARVHKHTHVRNASSTCVTAHVSLAATLPSLFHARLLAARGNFERVVAPLMPPLAAPAALAAPVVPLPAPAGPRMPSSVRRRELFERRRRSAKLCSSRSSSSCAARSLAPTSWLWSSSRSRERERCKRAGVSVAWPAVMAERAVRSSQSACRREASKHRSSTSHRELSPPLWESLTCNREPAPAPLRREWAVAASCGGGRLVTSAAESPCSVPARVMRASLRRCRR
jgi:hypothetical protein